MKKIPCLLDIDRENHKVLDRVNPQLGWLLEEDPREPVATRKYDGQACLLTEDGRWLTRRAVKEGKAAPAGFEAVETDAVTGTTFGWEPVENTSVRKAHEEALESKLRPIRPGTYELCGPNINGNPERFDTHRLIRHDVGSVAFPTLPQVFDTDSPKAELALLFTGYHRYGIEGIVWWFRGEPVAKLRVKDVLG